MLQLREVRMSAIHVVLPPGPNDDDGNGILPALPVGPDDDDGGIIGSLPPGPDDDDGPHGRRHSASYDDDGEEDEL
ncbi:MAG: hypothetical protein M3Z08_20965 [Chloroflexota bacterium]|nr:hypothetical protein [Chloroflexota bacterium]